MEFIHRQHFFWLNLEYTNGVVLFHSHFMQRGIDLMQHGIHLISASAWGSMLLKRIQTDITKEWYIVVSSQTYLHACPQMISKCTYLCRSIDLLLNHIKDEEVLEKVLEEEALQAKHIEEEQYALYLLSQIDLTLRTRECSDASLSTGAQK